MGDRVLGIDIGIKRTGLAISDALGISVKPLPNLKPKSRKEDADFIIDLALGSHVKTIVIGYPILPRSGDEGPMAKRARGFKEALEELISSLGADILVVLIEECYTSQYAQKRLIQSGVKKKKRTQLLDSEVARMLVEEFLATQVSRKDET